MPCLKKKKSHCIFLNESLSAIDSAQKNPAQSMDCSAGMSQIHGEKETNTVSSCMATGDKFSI